MKITEKVVKEPPKEPDINESLDDWPRHYYEETNPAIRFKMLKAAIDAGCDPEGDAIREKLFSMRYVPNQYADNGYGDEFMHCFMKFSMLSKNGGELFGAGRTKKKVRKDLESMGVGAKAENEELYTRILLDEFTHVGQLYISISVDSKQYTSLIWGFGKLKEPAIVRKLHTDLASAGIRVAEMLGMHGEMDLWLQGLERARARMIPETDPFV